MNAWYPPYRHLVRQWLQLKLVQEETGGPPILGQLVPQRLGVGLAS